MGPFGYQTPAGYLRRLRLSNLIFGDDVAFEGVLGRGEELKLATSQSYIRPPPVRFIPTEGEIQALLADLGFGYAESAVLWCRDDGTQLGDTHDRNFIRASDESIVAIDVQPPVVARTRLRLTDTQNKKARTTGRAFLS